MFIWEFILPGGATGTIRAADDDGAWQAVLDELGRYPDRVRVVAVADAGVAV